MSDKKQLVLQGVGGFINYLIDSFRDQILELEEITDKQDRMKLAAIYVAENKIRIEEIRRLGIKTIIDNIAAITLKDMSEIIDTSNGIWSHDPDS